MSDKRYCKRCEVRTDTVFNDFMVSFCAECHTMRGKRSDYTNRLTAFQCSGCGVKMDEQYVGQTICNNCSPI